MDKSKPGSRGLMDSLRSLGDGFLGSIKSRLELIAVELQEAKLRLIQNFILLGIALFAGSMAALFASLTLVCVFWDNNRLLVLEAVTLFYTVVLVATTIWLRRRSADEPGLFSASIQEIDRDRMCFRTGN